jgi:GNAT superfamily N-acetyltransferase
MTIRPAIPSDLAVLVQHDHHISPEELENLIRLGRICVAEEDGTFLGWLRWNLFWDNTPFMNLLFLLEDCRGKGHGKAMVTHWEQEMKRLGYQTVMTSTASDEYAQHFYRHLGYEAIGEFTLPGDPYELIFAKNLQEDL